MQVDCDLLQLSKIHLEKLTMLEFMKLIESSQQTKRKDGRLTAIKRKEN